MRFVIPVLIAVFVSVLAFGCRDYVSLPDVCCARPPEKISPESIRRKRMTNIVQALRAYNDEFGTLPPAYTRDEKGQPLTSWRVLILPQLGHHAIYAEYDQSQAWDSPANVAWSQKTPTPYFDPFLKDAEPGMTSFVGIVLEEKLPSRCGVFSESTLPEELASEALIVENLAQPVIWSQPVDLSPDEVLAWQSSDSDDSPYLNVGLANGRTWQFTNENRHLLAEVLQLGGGLTAW